MDDPSLRPTRERLDPLLDTLAGWYAAGATTEPRRVGAVERLTGLTDAADLTAMLEQAGVLEPAGRAYRLTAAGAELGGALAAGDDRRARAVARSHLASHPAVHDLRDVLRETPLSESELRPFLAGFTGTDGNRATPDPSTLLDLLEWTGILVRDPTDPRRFHPGTVLMPDGSGVPGNVPPGQQPPPPSPGDQSPSLQQQPPATTGGPPPQPPGPAGQQPPAQPPAPASGEEPARYATQEHALSVRLSVDNLELDVDGDANELEEIVRAVRRGLLPDDDMGT